MVARATSSPVRAGRLANFANLRRHDRHRAHRRNEQRATQAPLSGQPFIQLRNFRSSLDLTPMRAAWRWTTPAHFCGTNADWVVLVQKYQSRLLRGEFPHVPQDVPAATAATKSDLSQAAAARVDGTRDG